MTVVLNGWEPELLGQVPFRRPDRRVRCGSATSGTVTSRCRWRRCSRPGRRPARRRSSPTPGWRSSATSASSRTRRRRCGPGCPARTAACEYMGGVPKAELAATYEQLDVLVFCVPGGQATSPAARCTSTWPRGSRSCRCTSPTSRPSTCSRATRCGSGSTPSTPPRWRTRWPGPAREGAQQDAGGRGRRPRARGALHPRRGASSPLRAPDAEVRRCLTVSSITTPWWPSENNPFAGAFVAAQAEAVAPYFDRVDVVHTEDWATPAGRPVVAARPEGLRAGSSAARGRACPSRPPPGTSTPGATVWQLPTPVQPGRDYAAWARTHEWVVRTALRGHVVDARRRARSHRHLRRLGGHRLRPRRLPGRRHRARHVPAAGARAAGGARHVPAGARAGGLVLRRRADPEELAAQRLPGPRRPGADLPERGADGADPAAARPGDRPAPLDLPGQVRPAQAGRRAGRGVRRDRRASGATSS